MTRRVPTSRQRVRQWAELVVGLACGTLALVLWAALGWRAAEIVHAWLQ